MPESVSRSPVSFKQIRELINQCGYPGEECDFMIVSTECHASEFSGKREGRLFRFAVVVDAKKASSDDFLPESITEGHVPDGIQIEDPREHVMREDGE